MTKSEHPALRSRTDVRPAATQVMRNVAGARRWHEKAGGASSGRRGQKTVTTSVTAERTATRSWGRPWSRAAVSCASGGQRI